MERLTKARPSAQITLVPLNTGLAWRNSPAQSVDFVPRRDKPWNKLLAKSASRPRYENLQCVITASEPQS